MTSEIKKDREYFMNASNFLREQINLAIPERIKNVTELADKAGVSQPNLSEFVNGNRKSMNLETAWKILSVLGLEVRPKQNENPPRIQSLPEGLTALPVYAVAGAGPAWDDEESEPKFFIAVPVQYLAREISTLLVSGESMSPTILDNAVVGVNRDSAEVIQGKIYAVRLPYEGIVVKRLYLDHSKKCFILRSDNKNGDFPDIEIPFDEGDTFIYGRVEWVLQSYRALSF